MRRFRNLIEYKRAEASLHDRTITKPVQLYCGNIIKAKDCSYYSLEEYPTHLLVFGYIRLLPFNLYIPDDLMKLFVNFCYESMPSFLFSNTCIIDYNMNEISRNYNAYDPKIVKELMEINPNSDTNDYYDDNDDDIDDINADYLPKLEKKVYCCSQIGWNKNINIFKVRCINLSNGSNGIGIVSNASNFISFKSISSYDHNWSFDGISSGITYQIYFSKYKSYDGIYYHNNGTQLLNQKLFIKWEKNDIIKFVVNCINWTISFYINNKQVGTIINLVKNIKYYPAIAFGGDNDTKFQYIV